MKRISLNEEQFKQLVLDGQVKVEGESISLDSTELQTLISGGIVYQTKAMVALSDIGFDRIDLILKQKKS